jgi:hypothetical protein
VPTSDATGQGGRRLARSPLNRSPSSPQCEECQKVWLPIHEERWHAHWIDDGAEEKVVFYCPDCAERQFEMGD